MSVLLNLDELYCVSTKNGIDSLIDTTISFLVLITLFYSIHKQLQKNKTHLTQFSPITPNMVAPELSSLTYNILNEIDSMLSTKNNVTNHRATLENIAKKINTRNPLISGIAATAA